MFICLPLSRSFSLFVSCILFNAPSFHPHIKAIYHQDQTQRVSQRQADLLVGFLCVCEFYDWGRGPGTQGYISVLVSLWLLAFLALFMPSRWARPPWIARPHVNATSDLNSWDAGDVRASADQLLQWLKSGCIYSQVECHFVEKEASGKLWFVVQTFHWKSFLWQTVGEWVMKKCCSHQSFIKIRLILHKSQNLVQMPFCTNKKNPKYNVLTVLGGFKWTVWLEVLKIKDHNQWSKGHFFHPYIVLSILCPVVVYLESDSLFPSIQGEGRKHRG